VERRILHQAANFPVSVEFPHFHGISTGHINLLNVAAVIHDMVYFYAGLARSKEIFPPS